MSVFDLVIREGTAATASVFQTDISAVRYADPNATLAAKVVRHISCKASDVPAAVVLFPGGVTRRARRCLPIRRSAGGPAAVRSLAR
jgi:hypothetical protein